MRWSPTRLLFIAAKAAAMARATLCVQGEYARGDVARVFPAFSRPVVWWVAAEVQSHRAIGALLERGVARWGEAWLQQRIEVRGRAVLERLRAAGTPIVAVAWHAGVPAVLTAALAACGLRGVILRFDPHSAVARNGFVQVATGHDPRRKHMRS